MRVETAHELTCSDDESVLWITWLVVGLYDVRFVTDSLFGTATLISYE